MGRLDMGVRGERVQREGTPIRREVDTVCLITPIIEAIWRSASDFDKIELHLIRVLQTLITERSVSRAAMPAQLAAGGERPAQAAACAHRRSAAGARSATA